MFIIIIACCSWAVTRYVILLFVFNTVCYGYLRSNFRGFCRFLIHGNTSYLVLYTQCLKYNICSVWFLDIRISFHIKCNIASGMYKGWVGGCTRGGWVGVQGVGGWAAKGRLYPPLGLFGLALSPRSASHRCKHA